MKRRLLDYACVSDNNAMIDLVGNEFLDGIVAGTDNNIKHALNSGNLGKDISQIHWIKGLEFDRHDRVGQVLEQFEGGNKFLVSVTFLPGTSGDYQNHSLFIKVGTKEAEARKMAIAGLFIAGSVLCLILTSFAIISLMRKVIIFPIKGLKEDAKLIAAGNLDCAIQTHRRDELGQLAVSFVKMRDAIKKHIAGLTEAEERYRGIFENAVEGIFQVSPDGRLLQVNKSMAAILGYSSVDDLLEKAYDIGSHIYVHPVVYNRFLQILDDEDRVLEFEAQLREKGGAIIWGSVSARNVYDKNGILAYREGSFVNITERYEKEKAERERKVAQTGARAKSEFLARMSHEIRTPMNAVIGLARLVLKTELSPNQHDYILKLLSSAESLLRIIDDILDFSKIDAGKLKMEAVEFNLEEVFDNLSGQIGLKAEEKGIELILKIESGLHVDLAGDPLRLGQILLNLTDNALKFTETGEILISVEVESQEKDRIVLLFKIQDTGIGMARQQISNLFRPFSQADTSTTRKFGGTGLGLIICKRLVGMMGGKIWVESRLGKGSTFMFSAVFAKVPSARKQSYEMPAPHRGKRILLIDDNATAIEIIAEMLDSLAFDVVSAESGRQGLQFLEKQQGGEKPFELVLIDLKMPDMDGIQTAKKIRMNTKITAPKIILLLAYGNESAAGQAEKEGVDTCLFKPVKKSMLFETIMDTFTGYTGRRARPGPDTGDEIYIPRELRGARILIVEDNEINQQVVAEILEQVGFHVSLADNGRKGVELVEKNKANPFDAILMDIQMPIMDGYEAAETIRTLEIEKLKISMNSKIQKRQVPIIALTAHAMAGEKEKCIWAGMNDYLTKPINHAQLFTSLVRWIDPVKKGSPIAKTVNRNRVSTNAQTRSNRDKDDKLNAGLPEILEGIDLTDGLKRVMGNEVLYEKILLNFKEYYADSAERVLLALDGNDFDRAQEHVHKVRGAAGNIGASQLSISAGKLEMAIKGRHIQDLDELSGAFHKEMVRVMNAISRLDTPLKPVYESRNLIKDTVPGSHKFHLFFKELNGLLVTDLTEAIGHVEALESHIKGPVLEKEYELLMNYVESFDVESAVNCLHTIAGHFDIRLQENEL
jgi:two-component system sensor histidine kinase/response regulator